MYRLAGLRLSSPLLCSPSFRRVHTSTHSPLCVVSVHSHAGAGLLRGNFSSLSLFPVHLAFSDNARTNLGSHVTRLLFNLLPTRPSKWDYRAFIKFNKLALEWSQTWLSNRHHGEINNPKDLNSVVRFKMKYVSILAVSRCVSKIFIKCRNEIQTVYLFMRLA